MYTLCCHATNDNYWLINTSPPAHERYAWMTMGYMTLNGRKHARLSWDEAEALRLKYQNDPHLKDYQIEVVAIVE